MSPDTGADGAPAPPSHPERFRTYARRMIAIRPALPTDAEAIGHLIVCAWQVSFRDAIPAEVIDRRDPSQLAAYFSECLPSESPFMTVVADDGDQVAGFVHVGPNRDEDAASLAEVYGIYVDPDRHRQGIGRLLMSHALDWIATRSAEGATLWTLRNVPATRRFYVSMGWHADGTTKTVMFAGGHPIDEVRYRWDSAPPVKPACRRSPATRAPR